jgi:hypothetical protein
MAKYKNLSIFSVALLCLMISAPGKAQQTYLTVDASPFDMGAIPFDYGENLVVREASGEFEKCFSGRTGVGTFTLTNLSISSGMTVNITQWFSSTPGFEMVFNGAGGQVGLTWNGHYINFGGRRDTHSSAGLRDDRVVDVSFVFLDRELRLFINGSIYNTELIETDQTFNEIIISNIDQNDCLYRIDVRAR